AARRARRPRPARRRPRPRPMRPLVSFRRRPARRTDLARHPANPPGSLDRLGQPRPLGPGPRLRPHSHPHPPDLLLRPPLHRRQPLPLRLPSWPPLRLHLPTYRRPLPPRRHPRPCRRLIRNKKEELRNPISAFGIGFLNSSFFLLPSYEVSSYSFSF